MRHALIAALLFPLGLAGCQSQLSKGDAPAREVRLERPLQVPEDSARVFIQYGKVVNHYRVNAFVPHCNFEVRATGNDGAEIQPDSFRITRVQLLEEPVVFVAPVWVATIGGDGDGGPPSVQEGYHLWLQSERQPNVMRLSCHGVRDDRGLAQPPTPEEVDAALGDIARIAY